MKQEVTILVLEDNPDDFYLLREVLASSPDVEPTIFHENRYENAVSIAEREPVDVAILDLALPDSIGLGTFIAFHERFPLIPTIILTGNHDHDLAFQAVKHGAQDYLFKGEPSAQAIVRTIRYAIERQRLTTELKTALDHVKQLQGLLPICSVCKKIRDDKGYWNRIEAYISQHSEAQFSHGICPECAKVLYPTLFDRQEK